MTKADTGAEFEQSDQLRRGGRRDWNSELLGGPEQQGWIADRFGCCEEHEPLRGRGQIVESPQEAPLEPRRDREVRRHGEAARQLMCRVGMRKLEQRQRVPARLGDDPIDHPLVDASADHRREQRAGVLVVQTSNVKRGQTGEGLIVARLAYGEHDHDRLAHQPPGHKRERLSGRPVEPLSIVDHADLWAGLRELRDQPEHGKPDEIAIGRPARTESERDGQRFALRGG
jgi:hypothetical protein